MEQLNTMSSSIGRIEAQQNELYTEVSKCTSAINEHVKILSEHHDILESCRKDIMKLREALSDLSKSLNNITNKVSNFEPGTNFSNTSSYQIPEVIQRVNKSHNIIVLNAAENAAEMDDRSMACEIVEIIYRSASSFVISTTRVPSKNASRPSWMKIRFSNPEIVSNILRNKTALQGHPQYQKIIIQDDKTKQQIDQLNSLREQIRDRQEKGENNLTIKILAVAFDRKLYLRYSKLFAIPTRQF
ncbi:hypothetical protein WA026_021434 [Henosepilachna vigintioctopunctata]|uniref:Uncharacterized protein n=1 Tax=Henosepilachna vigintioctopunctata TaxID=420089 RepID=A0AAW1TYC5_9CUCU